MRIVEDDCCNIRPKKNGQSIEQCLVRRDAGGNATHKCIVRILPLKIGRDVQTVSCCFFRCLLNKLNRTARVKNLPFGFIDQRLGGQQANKRLACSGV